MGYYETGVSGLGSLPDEATFPAGAEFGVGFTATGLSAAASPGAVQTVRNSLAVLGTVVDARWGPAFGVPTGVLAAKVRLTAPFTGAQLNAAAGGAGQRVQGGLGAGVTVRNTYLHQLGTSGGGTPQPLIGGGGQVQNDPVADLIGPYPSPYDTALAPQNFFTQSVGGIPVWGILAGGVVALGAVGYVMMSSRPRAAASPAAVKANRRRRVRRNRRNRRSR